MSDLTRTGSNLASRGPCGTLTACLTTAANAVMTEPSDLNMAAKGMVIVTAVQANAAGTATIIGQYKQGQCFGGQQQGGSAAEIPPLFPLLPRQSLHRTRLFT